MMFALVFHVVAICQLASIGVVESFVSTSPVSNRNAVNQHSNLWSSSGVAPTVSYLDSLSTTTVRSDAEQERKLDLLDDALRSNPDSAADLLSQFNQLRGNGESLVQSEQFVSDLLDGLGDSDANGSLPWWTKIRPLTRFSRRARLASFQRVLDMSTPSADEIESIDEDGDARERRRRRSFLVLIRALADSETEDEEEDDSGTFKDILKRGRAASIAVLEKAARRDLRSTIKTDDMKKRTPPGLETPTYSVIGQRAGYEIRHYEPFSVCSVQMNRRRPTDASKTDAKISSPQLNGASSFGALAGYLFGKNQQSTSMKMTTPVLSEGVGDQKSMSFVLPSEFWEEGRLQLAPRPLEESGVQLQRNDGGDRAALMFGGFASKKDVEARKTQLLEGLSRDKEWMVDSGATITLAQYNDPFTPPWKRRNEV